MNLIRDEISSAVIKELRPVMQNEFKNLRQKDSYLLMEKPSEQHKSRIRTGSKKYFFYVTISLLLSVQQP